MTYRPRIENLVELAETGSTNDHAKTLARNGWPDATVVWAHAQTAGRGRQGNAWDSRTGNLFMSMILRPPANAALTGQLSFLAAVALAETARECLPEGVDIALKWPNDLLLGGKKAAGILLETEMNGVRPVGWVVIGVGVNVAVAPEGAASFADFGAGEVEPGRVLEILAGRIMFLYDLWLKDGFEPIRGAWLERAAHIGQTIQVRLPQESFSGKFLDIDGFGVLQVELDDGSRRQVASGEVFAA